MKKLYSLCIMTILSLTIIFGATLGSSKEVQAKESKAYTIKVNLGTNCTTIYKNGKAIKAMICSPSAETPTGTFYIPVKYRWHDMIGNCYAQYCSRITTGILFHSVWYYEKGDKSTMSVSAYNVMGQKASHGCVRLLCKDAKWIYDHCAVGTKIKIFWGKKKDDPIKRPGFKRINTGAFTAWDPTDPDPKNPWRKAKPSMSVNDTTFEYGTKIKLSNLVTVKDNAGTTISAKKAKLKTSGTINTKKVGKYKVTFTAKSNGKTIKKTYTFKVVDTKKPVIKGAKSKKNVALYSTKDILSGVKATAVSGKSLTSKLKVSVKRKSKSVKVTKGKIKFTSTGTYKITYKVTGVNKQTRTKTITYKVNDQRVKFALTKSSVTINGGVKFDPYTYVKYVKTYTGKALSAKSHVKVTGTVNTAKAGTYTITYTASNKYTYTARTAKLKVIVLAIKVPETTTVPETTKAPETTTVPETTMAD